MYACFCTLIVITSVRKFNIIVKTEKAKKMGKLKY